MTTASADHSTLPEHDDAVLPEPVQTEPKIAAAEPSALDAAREEEAAQPAMAPPYPGHAPAEAEPAEVAVSDSAVEDASAEVDEGEPGDEDAAMEEGPSMHVGGGAAGLIQEEPEPPRAVFADLGLSEPILQAISDMGYMHPTPIQEQAIPVVLMGRDVLGVAQTGTGKTASFTLPLMEILAGSRARARMPRSLILEPTRELALQVAENFVQYGKHLKLNARAADRRREHERPEGRPDEGC